MKNPFSAPNGRPDIHQPKLGFHGHFELRERRAVNRAYPPQQPHWVYAGNALAVKAARIEPAQYTQFQSAFPAGSSFAARK